MIPPPATRSLLAALLLLASVLPGLALDLTQKSVSTSKQFTVYCDDLAVRRRVANFAEEVKTGVLQMLSEPDRWRYPILITVERAATDRPGQAAAALMLIQSEAGFKVQIDVRIGSDPAEVYLQKHLVRAVFLEFAYRQTPELLEDGKRFVEAPWWLVEGTLQAFRLRDGSAETDFYKRIIDVNRLPPLEQFLAPRADDTAGAASQAVDSACAVCLLQLLLEQPAGRASMANYLRHLPTAIADPVAALRRDFPSLGETSAERQKWWTLNLARLSAIDRYKGLSPEETDAQLAALLQFDIPGDKGSATKTFEIGDFHEYMKLNAAKAVLAGKHNDLVGLASRANSLYRDIVGDYEQIFSQLARGKTMGVKGRLERAATYRESLLRRRSEIADYLNWFEATQMDTGSKSFEGYLRVANELAMPARRNDPITKYLDEISKEL